MKFFCHSERRIVYLLCSAMSILAAAPACALGLGELRTSSRLGERLHVEIDLVVQADERMEAGCVRLKKPQGEDLPWVKQGAYGVRRGASSVLTIQSQGPVFDPVVQVGVFVGCGFEVQRDYTVFLSPPLADPVLPSTTSVTPAYSPISSRRVPRQSAMPAVSNREERQSAAPITVPAKVAKPLRLPKPGKDRLVLFSGNEGNDPSLALSSQFASWNEGAESRDRDALRETLRIEYRMLQALHQQAVALLETAEKLRQLEQTLSELQRKTDVLGKQVQPNGVAAPAPLTPASSTETPAPQSQVAEPVVTVPDSSIPAIPPPVQRKPASKPAESDSLQFYGALVLAVLLIAAWLAWRHSQRRKPVSRFTDLPPALLVDPQRGAELEKRDPLDLELEAEDARGGRSPAMVDFPLGDTVPPPEMSAPITEFVADNPSAAQLSVGAATLDEHFEVNPVMELADIMLSFGRVKGAAQALQEFVDHNPEEALQPWIRLMDVYRLAGMRAEFEQVAANLNQYFNVEVQNWDESGAGVALVPKDGVADRTGVREEPLPIQWPTSVKKARSVEEMTHICNQIIEKWYSKDGIDYLQSLLRDNRGGLRSGFTIEVVDEILFLSEIQETLLKMDAEAAVENKSESEK